MNFIFGLYIAFGGSILLFLVAILMMVRSAQGKKARKVSEELSQQVYQDSIKVLEDTRRQSEEILQGALKKAESTISEAEFISKGAEEEFAKEIHDAEEKAVHSFGADYQKNEIEFQKLFEHMKREFQNQAQRTMMMFESVVQKEAGSFRQALQSQTVEAEKQVQIKVQQEFNKISSEIEAYKKAQIQGINQAVNEVVQDIVGEVLRKSITPQDHSELVMHSFEKAFQEGIIQKPADQNISN